MSAFAKLRAPFRRTATDDAQGPSIAMSENPVMSGDQKDPTTATAADDATDDANTNNSIEDGGAAATEPDRDVQYGVQDVEAMTLTWSKRSLIFVFCKYVMSNVLSLSLYRLPAHHRLGLFCLVLWWSCHVMSCHVCMY